MEDDGRNDEMNMCHHDGKENSLTRESAGDSNISFESFLVS